MIDRATHTCTPLPHPLAQAIRACLGSRTITQTTSAAGLALLLALPMDASAADFTVANRNDSGSGSGSGSGSLRQAVFDANASPGPDTVLFDASVTGTILLTSGALTVTDPLTLEGPGQDLLTIDGGAVSTILQVEDALSIRHLKLANAAGAAIRASTYWDTQIALVDSIVQGSTAAALDALYADVIIANSIITRNGQGILLEHAQLSVSDSTIADNADDGILGAFADTITIVNSRISENNGAGITVWGTDVTIQHTTVSGNESSGVIATMGEKGYYSSSLSAEDSVISGNGGDGAVGAYLSFQHWRSAPMAPLSHFGHERPTWCRPARAMIFSFERSPPRPVVRSSLTPHRSRCATRSPIGRSTPSGSPRS